MSLICWMGVNINKKKDLQRLSSTVGQMDNLLHVIFMLDKDFSLPCHSQDLATNPREQLAPHNLFQPQNNINMSWFGQLFIKTCLQSRKNEAGYTPKDKRKCENKGDKQQLDRIVVLTVREERPDN